MAAIELYDSVNKELYPVIYIYPRGNNISSQKIIDKLRKYIKSTAFMIRICSTEPFTITDVIFNGCNSLGTIRLDNIVLSEKAVASIPECAYCLSVSCEQPYLDGLRIENLVVSGITETFRVPVGVRNVNFCQNKSGNITIYCHDNLETLSFMYHNSKAKLVNCNNLQELAINVTSRVYGPVLDYIGILYVDNEQRVGRIGSLCKYLLRFKNLWSYEGYINKTILLNLPNIKRIISYEPYDKLSIDDIPDSLEDMKFYIRNVNSSDILKRKCNIRRLYYQEATIGPSEMIEKYSNVHFYTHSNIDVIRFNNKKLSSLTDLCSYY